MTHTEHTPASPACPARPKTSLPADGLSGRARRARAEAMAVRPLRDGRYAVETDGGTYVVGLPARTCTCPDRTLRRRRCKHLRRVAVEVTEGRVPPPGRRAAACAVCGARTFVPTTVPGPFLCDAHAHERGDLVRDREDDSLLVVAGPAAERADERVVPDAGRTVAAFDSNEQYGAHEPVVEAVYAPVDRPLDGTVDLDRRRYAFPTSRLVTVERGYAD